MKFRRHAGSLQLLHPTSSYLNFCSNFFFVYNNILFYSFTSYNLDVNCQKVTTESDIFSDLDIRYKFVSLIKILEVPSFGLFLFFFSIGLFDFSFILFFTKKIFLFFLHYKKYRIKAYFIFCYKL